MEQQDKRDDAEPQEAATAQAGEPAPEAAAPVSVETAAGSPETAAPERSAARSWPGLLALLIALGAAGGAGYVWWQQQSQLAELEKIAGLTSGNRELGLRLEGIQERLELMVSADDRLAQDLAAIRDNLASQQRQLDELPLRLNRLERALEEVPGVADQARSAWMLSEAEYYLRVANAQLMLARNPDVALQALQLADEKLRDIGDPGLSRVRALLADEMTALRALPNPDAEGIAMQLNSLSASLHGLPLADRTPESFGRENVAREDLSGLARAWAAIKEAFLSLVRVKRTDQTVTPLRTAAEESLLLRSMETELSLARLALIRGEGDVYRDALDNVAQAIRRHFDTQAPAVQGALAQLEEMAAADLPESMPDISGSLRLLLDLTNGAGAR